VKLFAADLGAKVVLHSHRDTIEDSSRVVLQRLCLELCLALKRGDDGVEVPVLVADGREDLVQEHRVR